MVRKGMGSGQGQGYKNIAGVDPMVHSQSAKGIKQPQRINPIARQGFVEVDEFVDNIEHPKNKSIYQKLSDKVKEEIKEYKQKQTENKLQELKEVRRPEVQRVEAQKLRVEELRHQYEKADDEDEMDRLNEELEREEQEYNEHIEKLTEINVEDFSDAELRTLAVRDTGNSSFLSDMFGSGENKYEKELLRRIAKNRELTKKINNAKKGIKPKEEGGILDDLF